jgi:hypothetical protein
MDQEEVTTNQLNENLNNETVDYKAAERTIDASQD